MRSVFARAAESELGRALTLALASACLLLPLLSQPLWRDEGSTFIDVSQPNVASVLDSMRVNELTPPLYFLLEHFWVRFAGTTEFALRFPSLIAMTLATALLYDTARRVRDRIAGYTTAACAALAPISLFVGSEARAYALTLLLGVVVMWLIAQMLSAPAPKVHRIAVGLALAIGALCWSNYTAWPAVVALLVVTPAVGIGYGLKRARLILQALAVGASAALPMISSFVSAAQSVHVQDHSQSSEILQAIGARLLWFNPLPIFGSAFTLALVGGTLTWFIALPNRRRSLLLREEHFLIVCLAVVLIGLAAAVRPHLQGYHLAAYAPAAWLIFGNYYARLTTWLLRGDGFLTLSLPRKLGFLTLAGATIFTISTFPFFYSYELAPRSGAEALAHELKRLTMGDVVIIAVPDTLSPSLYYYLRSDSRIRLRGIATWSKPWFYYYTTAWNNPSLKNHFLSLIDHEAATHRRLAFAIDWTMRNYNGHRYDLALEAAREEYARYGISYRRTFPGTIETIELTLLRSDRDPARRIPKR